MYQNAKEEPAKKPTENVTDRRRINQKGCASHRRSGWRRATNDIKPIGEEEEKLKRAL